MRRTPALAGTLLFALATAAGNTGCWAVYNGESDVDRTPVVNTGAGASVIYPGQSAPAHPGNLHPREAGYGQGIATAPAPPTAPGAPPNAPVAATPAHAGATAHLPPGAVGAGAALPPPEYASRGGSGNRGGGAGISMLGGAETDETRHVKISEEPSWLKYAGLPFAILAAPFEYGAKKAAGEPEPAPAVPRLEDQPRPAPSPPPVTDYERAQLHDLERELAMREASAAPGGAPPAIAPGHDPAPSSFADELAALRRRTRPAPAPVSAAPPRVPAPIANTPRATGEVDRNGDGRPDHWIERAGAAIARESFDEDFDGRPDRILVYDPSGREVVRIDEDTDLDGRTDAWTDFRAGRPTGRRVDANGDGHVDTWSLYHDGIVSRLERDADGDGHRDHVAFYVAGRLSREERDDDGDGRADLVKYFDDGERVERVEEDSDGDGRMDVVSHYEGGRLTRREVLDASVLSQGRAPDPEVN